MVMLRRKTIIFILILFFALGSWWGSYKVPSVSAGAAGSGWITDRLVYTDTANNELRPSMATDSNGYLWVAYEHYNSTTGHYEIIVSSSTDGGGTWVGELRAYNENYDFRYPSIAIDVGDNNNIYVAYEVAVTSTNHDIYVLRYVGGDWSNVYVDTDSDNDRFPSITSEYKWGTSDMQFISYERINTYDDRDIMCAESYTDGETWPVKVFVAGLNDPKTYSNSSITNAEGYIYVAYRNGTSYAGTSDIRVSRALWTDISQWTHYTDVDGTTVDCSWPSIAATHGGGRVVVAFQYKTSATNDDIYYSYSTDSGSTWSSTNKGLSLATSAMNERAPVLVVDGGGSTSSTVYGYVHVAYWDNNAIKYRKAYYTTLTSASWSTAQTVNSGTTVSATYSRPAVTTQYRNGSSTYYAGVAWTDTRGTTSTDVYYSTPGATYTIAPSPTGLKVTVDNTNYTASTSFNWVAGYNHTISAPSPQSNYYFISWSDGGARSHKITVGTTDTALTATLSYFVINLRTKDWSGNVLPSAIVSVTGLSNKTSSASGWANFTAVPPGTYTVKVYWRGSKVNQTSITITTSNKTMDLRSRVYSISFANSFKDSIGNTLYTPPSSFKLIAPNGTTTTSLSVGSYYLQNGTFRVSTITWNSTDITPSPSPTFDPTNGNPTILTKVFPHRNMLRPYDWPMFHQNPGHTGNTSSTAPNTNTTLWTYTTGGTVWSSPTVADGRVFVGSFDDKVYSLNASTGALIWSYKTGGDVSSSPAVAGDKVYVGSYDGKVYAFGEVTVGLNLRTVDWSGSILPSCNVTVAGVGSKTSSSNGWANFTLQSGIYTITARWQGSKVNQTSITLATSTKTMELKCKVYSLTLKFTTWGDPPISITPTQVIIEAPNGTQRTLTTYSIPRAQNGTWIIRQIRWQGNNIVTCHEIPIHNPSLNLTSSTTWTVCTRVYPVSFSDAFKDSIGNTLFIQPSKFTLLIPNGTAITITDLSKILILQNGTYTAKNITRLGEDATPSPAPTSDIGGVLAHYVSNKYLRVAFYLDISPSENLEEPCDWPMFHHNLGHTGYSTSTLPDTMSLSWNYGTGGAIQSSPTVSDGIVFFGSNDYKVYALNASTGKKLWTFSTGGSVYSSPTVVDGVVYVGSTDSYVYAINATTGKQKWKYYIGSSIYSSPTVADGKVYVAASYYVYALNATTSASTGEKLWVSKSLGYMYYSSPAVAYDMVYIGAGSYVYALNSTGGVVWSLYTGDTMYYSTPSIYDGKVYIAGYSKLYCLNATTTNTSGEEVWSYSLGTSTYPSPAVADGKVYFTSGYRIYAVDANDGSDIWDYYTGKYAYYSSPAVADGKVIVGAGSSVYSLNITDGSYLWGYDVPYNNFYSSPAVADGMVYVGNNDNKLYAFGLAPQYSLTFKFMDDGGIDDLTADISWILVKSPAGKTLNLTSYTLPQADSGQWTLTKIAYMKTNVIPSGYPWSPTITLTSDYTWTVNCRIYIIDFTNTFKEDDGSSLYTKPSNFTLLAPLGEAISSITVGKYYMWNGTWTWKSIFWEGSDVSPTYETTFNPENGNPTINCRIYKVNFANTFQDSQGAKLGPNPDYFRLLCPNGTTTQKLPVGSYRLQAGTFTFKEITWQGQDVTPSPPPTFDPTSDRNPTTRTKSVQLQTTISCQLSRPSITSGESLTISGSISPAVSTQVTIQTSTDGGNTWSDLMKVTSSSGGSYSYTWTPQSTGTYRVRAVWSGNAQYLGATSTATLTLTVSAPTQPVALPMPLIFGGIGIVVVIAVIAAVARRRKPKVVVPPPMDPRIRLAKCRSALTKLEDLRKQGKVSERVYRELKAEYEAEAAELEEKIAAGRRR